MKDTFQIFMIAILAIIIVSCNRDDLEKQEFDIKLKAAKISGFTPDSAMVGDTVLVRGINFSDSSLSLSVSLGAFPLKVIPNTLTDSTFKVKIPRKALKSKFMAITKFSALSNADIYSPKEFIPKYPSTVISKIPDTLFVAESFSIEGDNLDLITGVAIGDTIIHMDLPETKKKKVNFLFKNVSFTKENTSINFITMANDNYTDKGLFVMADYPNIEILAQFPDTAVKGEVVTLIFDRPEYGIYITKVDFGSKSPYRKATSLVVAGNKIYAGIPTNIDASGIVNIYLKYNPVPVKFKLIIK